MCWIDKHVDPMDTALDIFASCWFDPMYRERKVFLGWERLHIVECRDAPCFDICYPPSNWHCEWFCLCMTYPICLWILFCLASASLNRLHQHWPFWCMDHYALRPLRFWYTTCIPYVFSPLDSSIDMTINMIADINIWPWCGSLVWVKNCYCLDWWWPSETLSPLTYDEFILTQDWIKVEMQGICFL
jgi:hypothetical protein